MIHCCPPSLHRVLGVCRSCWHSHSVTPARARQRWTASDRIGAHGARLTLHRQLRGEIPWIVAEVTGSQHHTRAEIAYTRRHRAKRYPTPGAGNNLHTVTWLGGTKAGSRGRRAAHPPRPIPAVAPAFIESDSNLTTPSPA